MQGFSKVLEVESPDQVSLVLSDYRQMPEFMLENLENSHWVRARTGAPAPIPCPDHETLYIEDLVRLDILPLEKQLQWCLYYLNHSFSRSWDGLKRAVVLAEEMNAQIYISSDRWLYTTEPSPRHKRLSLESQLAKVNVDLECLEAELSSVGESCDGWLTKEEKGGKKYYRYMYYADSGCKRRKSHSVQSQELSAYREKIKNKKLKKRLQVQIEKTLSLRDSIARAIEGRSRESLMNGGEPWVWRVNDPLSNELAKKVSFSCYFEMPGSKGRPKYSKILPQLKYQAKVSNTVALSKAQESAQTMADILNEFSPGRIPSKEILLGIRNMIASGATLQSVKS